MLGRMQIERAADIALAPLMPRSSINERPSCRSSGVSSPMSQTCPPRRWQKPAIRGPCPPRPSVEIDNRKCREILHVREGGREVLQQRRHLIDERTSGRQRQRNAGYDRPSFNGRRNEDESVGEFGIVDRAEAGIPIRMMQVRQLQISHEPVRIAVLTASHDISHPNERGSSGASSSGIRRGRSRGASRKAAIRVVITTRVMTDGSTMWVAQTKGADRICRELPRFASRCLSEIGDKSSGQ